MISASPNVNRYFFQQTNNLHQEIISLHEFVLPTATALWNFRNIIRQEFEENENITVKKLSIKYNTAPKTRGSINLVNPFLIHSWETQRERLAEVALVNIIALFEVWCEDICDIFGRLDLAAKMQYPTNQTKTNGIGFAISEMKSINSISLTNSIYLIFLKSKKYTPSNLDNLLICFRYFKELRNSLMHRGRRCGGKLWGAQSAFIPVANKQALGIDFVPEHQIVDQGNEVYLSLHGVLGFTEIILRIVTTVDIELSATKIGEKILIERISSFTQTPIKQRSLNNLFSTMGWSGVILTPDFLCLLRRSGIII